MSYDSVIFDLDGVLLDSGLDDFQWMDRVRIKKAKEKGYDYDKDDAIQIVHASEYSQVQELLERKGMTKEEVLEIEHQVQNAKIELIEHGAIRLFPEAERILREIDRPVGLATNSPRKVAEFTLRYFGIEDLFDSFQALKLDNLESYVNNRKPSQYMLERVIEGTGCENPLMVGDSSDDIGAARNAEVDSVLVKSYSDGEGLNPTHEVRNLAELLSVID